MKIEIKLNTSTDKLGTLIHVRTLNSQIKQFLDRYFFDQLYYKVITDVKRNQMNIYTECGHCIIVNNLK